MPALKKKQTSQSAVTLHDYFRKPSAASRSKSDNQAISANSKKSKPSIAQDIIVIDDSDPEDDIDNGEKPRSRKKPRISTGSDDDEVEFVESPPIKVKSEAVVVPIKVEPTSETRPLPFGKPWLLLRKGTTTPASSSTNVEDASTHATENVPEPISLHPTASEDSSMQLEDEKSSEGVLDEPSMTIDLAEDDWGTGDDEIPFNPLQQDEDDEVQEISHELLNMPLGDSDCSTTSLPMDIDMDEKPLQPLSSYPPPIVKPQGPLPLLSCDGKTGPEKPGSNAFSILMSSHKENEAWKEATTAEDPTFRPTKTNGRRKAPFYKVLQGMPIAVDAFRYGTIPGITAYFLTHAHSDHYTNLASNWKSGPIYCSEGTANLIIHMLGVDKKWVNPLPWDIPTVIPNTGGVTVTLIEANHCPGSSLFFFEGKQTVNAGDSAFKSPFVGSPRAFRYLHCGDFRASPQHVLHPSVKGKKIDHVYLDTTYLDPKYTFPPQPLVISACADLAQRLISGNSIAEEKKASVVSYMKSFVSAPNKPERDDKLLFVVGTYSIGKERIVKGIVHLYYRNSPPSLMSPKAIAHALNSKIYCDNRKAAILRCQADKELDDLLTSKPLEAQVHLLPLGMITSDKIKIYLERFKGVFTKVIGFRPTGWTFTPSAGQDLSPSISQIIGRPYKEFTYNNLRPSRQSTSHLQLFPVPYSEHSSFFELTCFAMSFNWVKMIATVNVGSENSRNKMAKWVGKWEAERKKREKDVIIPYRHPEYW